jgi:hypothetical protein
MGAVGNKTLFGCLPLPPSPGLLPPSIPLFSPCPPPSHPTPLGQFSTVSLYLEDGL